MSQIFFLPPRTNLRVWFSFYFPALVQRWKISDVNNSTQHYRICFVFFKFHHDWLLPFALVRLRKMCLGKCLNALGRDRSITMSILQVFLVIQGFEGYFVKMMAKQNIDKLTYASKLVQFLTLL